MSAVQQAVFQNHRSFGIAIGSALGGGFFAGQISTSGNGIATHNLIVGPVSSAQGTYQWKIVNTSTAGTSSTINGPSNSATMNDATHPAAQFCEGLTIGGFSDWYMPASLELEVCYYNLKPTTSNNNTNTGTNAYAVPARASNYTIGTPAQTSAADFKDTGAEDFISTFPGNMYWSSTESTASYAIYRAFNIGASSGFFKNNTSYQIKVRAIRRVAV
jgi:hypothetical protein